MLRQIKDEIDEEGEMKICSCLQQLSNITSKTVLTNNKDFHYKREAESSGETSAISL